MRLFTINNTGQLTPYREKDFKLKNKEIDLEVLLENNPQYFFDDSEILIIGRQVTTNLNSTIDLLALDKFGDSIIIELKRDKTPRETVAQLLEYASFVENLDYEQLNNIFNEYFGEEVELEEYHKQYFVNAIEKISFNKSMKLIIVAQNITKEIKQTANYLRKCSIDIYCLEFKYFQTESWEKIITFDFIIGDQDYKKGNIKSASLPKISEKDFINSLDENGKYFFNKVFEFAKNQSLIFIWGSKGFSLNLNINNESIALFFGYPPDCVFKQSIYTGFESISKKVKNSDDIIDFYKQKLLDTGHFVNAGINIKWIIDKKYDEKEINDFLNIITEVIQRIKEKMLDDL